MIVNSKIVKELNILKRDIIKKYDKKEMTESEYKKAMAEITEMLDSENNKEIAKEKTRIDNFKTIEVKKMTKENVVPTPEVVKKEKPVKVKKEKVSKVKKEKTVSRQDVILKVMQMKSMKTVEQVVTKVLEIRPEPADKLKDVLVHVRWTIQKFKKPTGRFLKYNFEPEGLQLTLKE